jgi:methanethiol S-methyltransferase
MGAYRHTTAWRIVRVCVPLAALHSALASRQAKDLAARLAGERRRNGLYRVTYVGQSLLTFAWLYRWLRRLPDRPLYDLRGPAAWLARGGQAVTVAAGFWTSWEIGLEEFNGMTQLRAYVAGEPVAREPEAQGPVLGRHGEMVAAGPFALVRHPANVAAGVVLLLDPRMTERKLVVGLLATAYGYVGSLHEERRLQRAYGEAYERYREHVPFFVPVPARRASDLG